VLNLLIVSILFAGLTINDNDVVCCNTSKDVFNGCLTLSFNHGLLSIRKIDSFSLTINPKRVCNLHAMVLVKIIV
jgi:hypothetical protein